jgi:hypothetical protein
MLQFVLLTSIGIAQKNACGLLSFKGEGTYTHENSTKQLTFPLLFNGGDKVKITKGNANLILANGNEVPLSAVNEYTVPQFKKEEMILELDPSVFQDYDVQSQSNSALTMRGDSANLLLYPISAKVIDKNNARIFWNIQGKTPIKPGITFSDLNTLDVVYKTSDVQANEISLKNIPLKEGQEYTWTFNVKEANTEQLGIISIINNTTKAALPHFSYSSKTDYLKAYTFYNKNEYYFDAYNVIEEACKKFPEIDLFHYLNRKMKGEK